jgi:hypothetical protein
MFWIDLLLRAIGRTAKTTVSWTHAHQAPAEHFALRAPAAETRLCSRRGAGFHRQKPSTPSRICVVEGQDAAATSEGSRALQIVIASYRLEIFPWAGTG